MLVLVFSFHRWEVIHQRGVVRDVEIIEGSTKLRDPLLISLIDSIKIHGIQTSYASARDIVRVWGLKTFAEYVGFWQIREVRFALIFRYPRQVLLHALIGRNDWEIEFVLGVELFGKSLLRQSVVLG